MSPKPLKTQLVLYRGISLSLGAAMLLGSSSASASSLFIGKTKPGTISQHLPLQISQSRSTPADVIIDTEPNNTDTTSSSTTSDDPRFKCEFENGQYVVMYYPKDQQYQAYPWAVPQRLGGGWTEQKRCYAISERLESYRPDGLLELRTSTENGYDILCATTEVVSDCRIVLTVPPGQDPIQTRNLVFENLLTADSGEQTVGVNTFTSGSEGANILNQVGQILRGNRQRQSDGINLQDYLAPDDGGTANQLQPSASNNSSDMQLNPENFR